MSKGYTIGRILLTILLSFFMSAFILTSSADPFLNNSGIYTDIIREEKLADKVYNSIENDFGNQYNTTAIPAEVYMDAISTEWIEDEMCRRIGIYLDDINGIETDYVTNNMELEESITSFFHEYAESIDYTPDEAFDKKLSETIINATSTISNRMDAFYMKTISKNSAVQTAAKYLSPLKWLLFTAVIIMSFILAFLERTRNARRLYWIGTGFFCGSALTAIPCVYLLCTDAISSFAIKEQTTYTAITTLLNNATWSILARCIVYGAVGITAIAIYIVMSRKLEKSEEKSK